MYGRDEYEFYYVEPPYGDQFCDAPEKDQDEP